MGWCSATEIFDDVAQFVLMSSVSEEEKFSVLLRLAITLENNDWDCQQDSKYYDTPIVQRVFKDLHSHWFEEDN